MNALVKDNTGLSNVESSRRKCFVVSPIGPYGSEIRNHMDIVFHCIIEPALSERYMSEQSMIWTPHLYCKQTGQSPAVRVDVTVSQLRKPGLENCMLR